MQKGVNTLLIGLQAIHEVGTEAVHAVRQNADTVEQVADQDGLEDVQLELAVHATDGSGDVVTHDLSADHGKGLALGGVNLAGHDRRTGLVLGEVQLAETAAGAGAEVADILGDLEQRAGKGVQRAGGLDNGVVSSQNLELIGGGLELGAGHLGDLGGNSLIEALEGVQTGTDGGTTLSEETQVRDAGLDPLDVTVELSDVAGELLTQSEGSGILQVSTANLDDVVELLDLLLQSVAEGLEGGQEGVLELDNGGNVHNGGEGVVGGGRHVNVIVGVNGLLGAHGAAHDFNGAVGDDLVRVHVGLGTGAGLPDDQREVVEELTLGDLGGGLLDGLTDLGVYFLLIIRFNPKCAEPTLTKTVLHVDGSGGTLKDTESLDNWGGHAVLGLVDVEVTQGAVPKTVSASCTCIPSHSK